jgi:hypothetical protein
MGSANAGGAVSAWSDASGNEIHATPHTGGLLPPIAAPSAFAFNFHPALQFNRDNNLMHDNATEVFGSSYSEGTILAVAISNGRARDFGAIVGFEDPSFGSTSSHQALHAGKSRRWSEWLDIEYTPFYLGLFRFRFSHDMFCS